MIVMKKYLVNTYEDHWVECDSAESAAQEVIDLVDDCYWDDLLDDVWGETTICGLKYCTSRVLKMADEVVYRCGKNDWLDGEYREIVYSLERMVDGDEEDYFGITVRYEEVSDDEEDEEDE